jgi:thioredoxin 1
MEIALTDQNFEREVLGAKIPVLVDFWAPWCAPCRMVAPVLDELAEEFEGKIKVGKLDVEKNPTTAQKYGVMGIPTLVFFKSGTVAGRLVGVQPKEMLTQKIKDLLVKGESFLKNGKI